MSRLDVLATSCYISYMQLEERHSNVIVLRKFLATLRERKSNPLYNKKECEVMISAIEAALEAYEHQIFA